MTIKHSLVLDERTLRPSGEWAPDERGWQMVRIAEGIGYWLHRNAARELNAGDCFAVAFKGIGSLRVSQMGPLRLQYYAVDPRATADILTVAEGQRLDASAIDPMASLLIYPAAHPLAQDFARVVDQSKDNGLLQRCRLLQLWADAIAGLLAAAAPEQAHPAELRAKLRHLIGQITETELTTCSLADLAQRLGCSERHFRRLFREEFGVAFRKRQMELRLRRAG
jgi:AraC-like DNA-binding protein